MMEKSHPQSLIETIGKYGCLGFCYIYCSGINPDNDVEYYRIMSDAIKKGVKVSGVKEDCFIENPDLFISWLTGRKVRVSHEVCVNIEKIKKPTPVRFYYINEDGKRIEHFVVAECGQVVFDPVQDSRSVSIGHPDSARIITYL